MGLDYRPMTATEHRARWAAATAVTWDVSAYAWQELPADADRPGLHPEHLFDHHDGLRLIVSVDRYEADGRDYLHVSASAVPDSSVWRRIKKGMGLDRFSRIVQERVFYLSGRHVTLAYVTAPKGVPHYYDPPLQGRPEG